MPANTNTKNHSDNETTTHLESDIAALIVSKAKTWTLVLGLIISVLTVCSFGGGIAYRFYLKPQADIISVRADLISLTNTIKLMDTSTQSQLNGLQNQVNILLRRMK